MATCWSTSACCCSTSTWLTPPSAKRCRVRFSPSVAMRMMSCVVSICACNDASVMRGVHHVGGQRQVGGQQLPLLVFGLGVQLLDLPAHAAEQVQRVGDVHVGGIVRVVWPCPRRPKPNWASDACWRCHCALRPTWGTAPPCAARTFSCACAQRCPGGGDVGVGLQRQRHEVGDLLRLEQRPPVARNVPPLLELLRRAAGHRGRYGPGRQVASR